LEITGQREKIFELTTQRFRITSGVFTKKTETLELYRVKDIETRQTFFSRNTVKIEVSPEEDAAFAILDIDSLWRDKDTRQEIQWKGRVCKFYTKMTSGDWKFILQTGPLDYAGGHSP
jgi:uncharacterized membrane protein YdbT with pleckstrin-like domain